jgi:hypothetical protein
MRVTLAWILIYLGFGICRVNRWMGKYGVLYPVYNWLMVKSSLLQGDDPRGPWQPVVKEVDWGPKQGAEEW